MAEQTTEHLNVAASIDRCIETILDFERYPEWAPDIKASIVIERDEQGRATRVAFRAAAVPDTSWRIRTAKRPT
jgi:ribosome-associated toxin RatA of RatAB toxin-antitoxin module